MNSLFSYFMQTIKGAEQSGLLVDWRSGNKAWLLEGIRRNFIFKRLRILWKDYLRHKYTICLLKVIKFVTI